MNRHPRTYFGVVALPCDILPTAAGSGLLRTKICRTGNLPGFMFLVRIARMQSIRTARWAWRADLEECIAPDPSFPRFSGGQDELATGELPTEITSENLRAWPLAADHAWLYRMHSLGTRPLPGDAPCPEQDIPE
ncbi:hypothetical protein CBOM_05628 [Ceraceosorus bombacis]|uniref:Uncharacterized protein n=1 Tax=Ceraceosorus bombacis TaxID=401625 RepID=A0A0P1BPW1_9BASI|nr:hypothetical protein CBOM_05628 [Ceraceosorus bombacis]